MGPGHNPVATHSNLVKKKLRKIISKSAPHSLTHSLSERLTTHHHACRHSNAPSTVRVGDDITIADAEERYGYQPHCVEQVGVLLVVISDERKEWRERREWKEGDRRR